MKTRFAQSFGSAATSRLCVILVLAVWLSTGLRCQAFQADKPAVKQAAPPALREDLPGDRPERRVGRLLRIPSPINSAVDARIRRIARKVIDEAKRDDQWPVLIFEVESGRSDFGKAYDLAKFIATQLTGATTVAYVPGELKGHAVLLVMACDQIVMAEGATIGQAGIDEPVIGQVERSSYVDIANRRRRIPEDLALGMLDPALEVWEVETDVGREFVLTENIEALKKRRTFDIPPSQKPLIPRGEAGLFTGIEARRLGIIDFLADDRAAVAKALGLPRESLEEDPSLDGQWRTMRVQVKGPITAQAMTQVQRIVQDAISTRDVNFICVWIESPGGSPVASMNLANYLAGLNPGERRTVAYIPKEARGDAAFIALACDHIVMHAEAELGGSGAAVIDQQTVDETRRPLEELARRKFRSPSLAAALVDSSQVVYRYTRTRDNAVEYMTEIEASQKPENDPWQQGDEVTQRGKTLLLDGHRAVELAMAEEIVENFEQLKQVYGLEGDPELLQPGWADVLIDALRHPSVTWFLLLLGSAALWAELQSPGVGVGAFVAAVCFLVFFWANYLGGTAGWLEVLLFVLGVACILLELFVLPGFGVFGLGGGALVILSVVLATQTFVGLPKNDYQAGELQNGLLLVVATGIGLAVVISVMHRLLPHTPMLNRMVLAPPSEVERAEISRKESLASFEHLLGRHGIAITPLTPAGKVSIDGELINVISSGELVSRDAPVVVVEARGNRVVVKPLNS